MFKFTEICACASPAKINPIPSIINFIAFIFMYFMLIIISFLRELCKVENDTGQKCYITLGKCCIIHTFILLLPFGSAQGDKFFNCLMKTANRN